MVSGDSALAPSAHRATIGRSVSINPRLTEEANNLHCPKCERRFDGGLVCIDDGTPLVRTAYERDPLIGRTLGGRFTIRSKLGAGSMGTVYRASQDAMGREVAIKILRNDRAVDDNSKARFLREARANSLLTSPHTVTVFDFGESESGELYLAMELLNGESLGQRLARVKRLPIADAIETTRQALRSLGEAHGKGIIHRDLKPDNIFYAQVQSGGEEHEEIVKVLDFGIAKMLRDEDRALNAVETQAGTVFGTPRFMSPEQAQGKVLDARSDIYSLGVILYHMLTGNPPFTDDDAILVMARHIKTAPAPLSQACPEARIPPELERLVLRVLSKDPNNRPNNADGFATELARTLDAISSSTSGVRVSVGPSIPPPPSSLDDVSVAPSAAELSAAPARSRGPVIVGLVLGIALLVIAGAVGAILGKRENGNRGVAAFGSSSIAAPSTAVSIAVPPPLPTATTSDSVRTLHVEDLPPVSSSGKPLKGPVRPFGVGTGVPAPTVPTAHPTVHPVPSASSTRPYTKFD
ncbi:MAG: serine/threonine protein kinase [Polyangiaceae bacterium]|nr:serine/threonine protein kinase [Polyangiaceae bacterium]